MSPYLLAPGHFAAKARTISVLHGATAVADVLGQHPLVAELVIRRYLTAMRASVGLGTARRRRVEPARPARSASSRPARRARAAACDPRRCDRQPAGGPPAPAGVRGTAG